MPRLRKRGPRILGPRANQESLVRPRILGQVRPRILGQTKNPWSDQGFLVRARTKNPWFAFSKAGQAFAISFNVTASEVAHSCSYYVFLVLPTYVLPWCMNCVFLCRRHRNTVYSIQGPNELPQHGQVRAATAAVPLKGEILISAHFFSLWDA